MVKKDIVLFGTGKYFENYMMHFGQDESKRPAFAVDNEAAKAGSVKCGIQIRTPEALKEMNPDEFYVVICAARYAEIGRQLETMGIMDYQYYKMMPVDDVMPRELSLTERRGELKPVDFDQAQQAKPYRIGYIPSVFDLFHIGHLNLIRKAKSRCEYLIVGVLTDEAVEHFKKRKPVVPYVQRMAIVSAIAYVDRVVPVDVAYLHMIDAWKRYHYDCGFSEAGQGIEWEEEVKQLQKVRAKLELFESIKPEAPNVVKPAEDAAEHYRVPDKMRRTWDVELAMLDEVDRICKKHGLQYFLVHGSLLGAVRHKGFIPWDDDLDIAMSRKDYDRFVELAGQELAEPLSIHTPSTEQGVFWGGYARIRNSQTTAMEPREMGHEGNLGIWVDILPFDVCTLDDKKFALKEKRIRYCQRLIYAERYGRDFKAYAGLRPWKWKLYRVIAKLYGHDRLGKMLDAAQRLYSDEDSDQIAFFTGMGQYRRLQADNFREAAELEFAGRMVPVPVGYEKYLFEIMGRDYMQYPPEEERKPKHRGIYDPERPYTDYVNLLFDIFVDTKGKKIILFGAGLMFEDYMKKHGDKYRPAFLVDNDENKWGRSRMGIPIRKPEDILEIPERDRRLIICSYYYREISEQLDKMGIHDYKIYVQELEWILRTEEQHNREKNNG